MVEKIKHKCKKCETINYLKEAEMDYARCWFCRGDAFVLEGEQDG